MTATIRPRVASAKRSRALHGLNLRMTGRLSRPAPPPELSAAELDRRVRVWRVTEHLARTAWTPALDPSAQPPRLPAPKRGVRRIARQQRRQLGVLPAGIPVVLEELSGVEPRSPVRPSIWDLDPALVSDPDRPEV